MILLFNGPPGCGKDAACEVLEKSGFTHLSFKHELYKSVCDFYKVDYDWFMIGYINRDIKENKREQLLGWKTRRQAMIYVAELYIKPAFGKGYYGKQAANQIKSDKNYCISDLGYLEELNEVANKVGADNVAIVQVEREGCDFSKDQRSYIGQVNEFSLPLYFDPKDTPKDNSYFIKAPEDIRVYKIYNNSTLENFHSNVNHMKLIL